MNHDATTLEHAPASHDAGGVRARSSNISVVIIAFNEELNIRHALESVREWADDVFVVDSNSTDRTREIAEDMGATVVIQPWLGYARQKNWSLNNLPINTDWVFILDADEAITPELRDELLTISKRPASEIEHAGFYVNRLTFFMGKPLRHCGYFPSWNLRFFRHGMARYEDRDVHEHMMLDGTSARLDRLMLHHDRRGLEHFIAKHNRYSTLEALELLRDRDSTRPRTAKHLEKPLAVRRWLKHNVLPRIPAPWLFRFVFTYVFQLGFLDGLTGLRFCLFLATYDFFISIKLRELRRSAAAARRSQPAVPARSGSAADAAAEEPESEDEAAAPPPSIRGLATAEGNVAPAARLESTADDPDAAKVAAESSPWSTREKIFRAVWMLTGKPIFRVSFHNWYGFRSVLLRMFGAKVGKRVRIRPSASVEIPWNVELGDDVTIGDYAIIYSLGTIRIGDRTIVSQYAHLCAGTHDYTDRRFPLIRPEIVIGEDAWIGADAFVGPAVNVGRLAVLGARSSAYKSLEDQMVYVGNPAKALKKRELS